jgi:hypothetical protein
VDLLEQPRYRRVQQITVKYEDAAVHEQDVTELSGVYPSGFAGNR